MAWNDDLVGPALQIAATEESPLRVMAGPGTGKSFAMKRRIARLLEEGVAPERILAVTFTRNAAASLVDDLNNLGVEGCDRIVAGTLHGICFRLLSGEEALALSGRTPRPLVTFTTSGVLQFEGKVMLADVCAAGAFGAGRASTARIRAFEAAWARLQSEQPGWPDDPIDIQFSAVLTQWLRFHRAMLIGELVPETRRYLRNNPACPARSAYDYVIVDEYQDLNKAEQEVVDLLASAGETAIVGDVDQSIFRFRHANPEGIENFSQTHPQTHDEQLDECRRCPIRVVALADALIRHNHVGHVEPRLRPRAGNPLGTIHIVQWPSIEEEVQGIATYVSWLVNERAHRAGDILIVTPRRLIAYQMRDKITDLGIPAHSFYQEEALEAEEAQLAFALLTLLLDNEDRVALRWWLGQGVSTCRVGPYRRLREYCEANGVSPWQALAALLTGQLELPNAESLVTRFRELTQRLAGLGGLDVSAVVEQLLPEGVEGCSVLREAALFALPECGEVSDLFETLKTVVTQPEMPEEGNFARIMSLHKSKGLTSRVAIIAGCVQGLIPFQDPDEPAAEQQAILAEQRRLFYVAITRCTETLLVSSALRLERQLAYKLRARFQGRGNVVRTIASQFIEEMGATAPPARAGAAWAADGYCE